MYMHTCRHTHAEYLKADLFLTVVSSRLMHVDMKEA